jgi:RNA polymerase sigma-70 factor (ECF subfamily)
VLVTDGGLPLQRALRPIHGADKVARFLLAVTPTDAEIGFEWATVNGGPAMLLLVDGRLDSVASLTVEDGRVAAIYLLRNPDKLGAMSTAREVRRR